MINYSPNNNQNFNITIYSNKTSDKYVPDNNDNEYDAKTLWENIKKIQKEIKIKKFEINLIFFYEDSKEFDDENFKLFNELKLKVLGGFCGIKNIKVFEESLKKLEKLYLNATSKENKYSFVLISTGSSFEKIEKLCREVKFIKRIIIYCMDVDKNKDKYKSNKKISLISNDFDEIRKKLEERGEIFHDYNKKINNEITRYPFISEYEYDNYYCYYHKMYSLFFKEDLKEELKFTKEYRKKIFEFIRSQTNYSEAKKNQLKKTIDEFDKSNNFLEDALKFYTSENDFVYFINRIMRNIDIEAMKLSFLIGPMHYSMIRYVNDNKEFALTEDKILYRNIETKSYDLNNFYMAKNKIICFPSFTSTSLKKNSFKTTKKAKKVNNLDNEKTVKISMTLNYKHNDYNSPQAMLISKFSQHEDEEEVLFFPFTFVKVNNLKIDYDFSNGDIIYALDCNIINRNTILEKGLKNNKEIYINNNGVFTYDEDDDE